MQIKISQIRDRIAGDWYLPPISLKMLSFIDKKTAGEQHSLSNWLRWDGNWYKDVILDPTPDEGTGVVWPQDYTELHKDLEIDANCLWRIDFAGSNLGDITVAEINMSPGFHFGGYGFGDIKGGRGIITLQARGTTELQFDGHIRIEYKNQNGTQYVDIPIHESGMPATGSEPLTVQPPRFERSGQAQSLTVSIYNAQGGSVSVYSHPSWVSGFNLSQVDMTTWTCTFNISANDNLCHLSRTGQVTFQDGNFRSASTSILQEGYKGSFPVIYDPDGNSYPYVQIGDYLVMTDNLRTTKFTNGVSIQHIPDNSSWGDATIPAYCMYNNEPTYGEIYGYLYNAYVARSEASNGGLISESEQPYPNDFSDDRNWHIPSYAEWDDIIDASASSGASDETRALAMKCGRETPNPHPRWNEELGGNNASGFSAFGQGTREKSGDFWGLGFVSSFWTSTEHPTYSDENYVMAIPTIFRSGYAIWWFQRNLRSWALCQMNSGNAIRLARRI